MAHWDLHFSGICPQLRITFKRNASLGKEFLCIHDDFSSRPDLLLMSAIMPSPKESAGHSLYVGTVLHKRGRSSSCCTFHVCHWSGPDAWMCPNLENKKTWSAERVAPNPVQPCFVLSFSISETTVGFHRGAPHFTACIDHVFCFLFFCFFNPLGCKHIQKRWAVTSCCTLQKIMLSYWSHSVPVSSGTPVKHFKIPVDVQKM